MTRPSLKPGQLVGCLALWLLVGWGGWAVFVDRQAQESWLLFCVALVASAGVLWLAFALRRVVVCHRIEAVEVTVANAGAAAAGPVRFAVRLRARGRPVTVSRVAATLSRVDDPRDERGRQVSLPVVLGREETALGEQIRVAPAGPVELSGAISLPVNDNPPPGPPSSRRLQLDVVAFIGSKIARRTTVLLGDRDASQSNQPV